MMLCPKCHDQVLVIVERQGIEIDYCPGCRGVWLDRGELEKLIAQAGDSSQPEWRERSHGREYERRQRFDDADDDRDHGHHRRRRGVGGFLGDFFDFD